MHDVDRYRGSCLIVSKPRGGRSHPRGRPSPQDSGQQPPLESSAGYMLEGGSALAGMPLFSFLPQRRGSGRPHQGRPQHHIHHTSPPHYHRHAHLPQQQQIQQQQQQRGQRNQRFGKPAEYPHAPDTSGVPENGDELERLPLARLALHTQGAPLILANRGPQRSSRGSEVEGSPAAASDAVSVTSDEGSTGHAENCLPRIIKPRKRRKKDRKPVVGSPPPTATEGDGSGSIVTLKPYLPMCYNYHSKAGTGCEGSRTCGCGTCVPSHVFPTPPPSPASSSSSVPSSLSSASSSCSSSEDEPMLGWMGGHSPGPGPGPGPRLVPEGRSQLVRSLSEPQSASTLHISSTVTHSFAGHRDLDIRIVSGAQREAASRTRHWSVSAPSAVPRLTCLDDRITSSCRNSGEAKPSLGTDVHRILYEITTPSMLLYNVIRAVQCCGRQDDKQSLLWSRDVIDWHGSLFSHQLIGP